MTRAFNAFAKGMILQLLYKKIVILYFLMILIDLYNDVGMDHETKVMTTKRSSPKSLSISSPAGTLALRRQTEDVLGTQFPIPPLAIPLQLTVAQQVQLPPQISPAQVEYSTIAEVKGHQFMYWLMSRDVVVGVNPPPLMVTEKTLLLQVQSTRMPSRQYPPPLLQHIFTLADCKQRFVAQADPRASMLHLPILAVWVPVNKHEDAPQQTSLERSPVILRHKLLLQFEVEVQGPQPKLTEQQESQSPEASREARRVTKRVGMQGIFNQLSYTYGIK